MADSETKLPNGELSYNPEDSISDVNHTVDVSLPIDAVISPQKNGGLSPSVSSSGTPSPGDNSPVITIHDGGTTDSSKVHNIPNEEDKGGGKCQWQTGQQPLDPFLLILFAVLVTYLLLTCSGKYQRQNGQQLHKLFFLAVIFSYMCLTCSGKCQRQTGQKLHKLFFFAVILSNMCLTSSAGAVCPENQTAELGRPGYIHCNFSEGFNSVFWFDNSSDGSNAVVAFNGDKSGSGYETGIYDIDLNGSLNISNVTTWHERPYTCIVYQGVTFESYKVALQVIASPARNQFPTIQCQECHQEYFNSVMIRETLTCSFGSARPPAQVEWFEQRGNEYQHVEMQQSDWTENSNGTYRSTATLHSLQDRSNLIHSLMCKATWPLSDWRKQREILLDFSSSMSFSDMRPKVQYMEINKHFQIHCGDSANTYVVWKRISSNNEPEVIGFHSHLKTEITGSNTDNVEVSTEGSLIFSSPQVQHEGIYACIYGDGEKEEIEMTNMKLLIPPSPPYIQITGCNDASSICVFREESSKELTCAVYAARPNVTLEWVAEDEHKISFFNHKEVHIERGTTSDTVLTVQYSSSQDILCGEEIVIKCHLYGPLANIMKAESTAVAIIPATCMEHRGNSEQIFPILTSALVFVIIMILVLFVWISCFKRLGHHVWMKWTSSPEHRDVNGGNDEDHQDSIERTSIREDPVVSAQNNEDPQI